MFGIKDNPRGLNPNYGRPQRRRRQPYVALRLVSWCTLLFLAIDYALYVWRALSYESSPELLPAVAPQLSVFIASAQWNSGWVLREHWNGALLDLVVALGRENVFVSVFESGSWDDTKPALAELDERLGQLGVARAVVMEETTHYDEIVRPPPEAGTDTNDDDGWVTTPDGTPTPRRIPFLARVRNRSLAPLAGLVAEGRRFDRIVFLNDVVFRPEDVLTLINTRNGDYAAACSLDFKKRRSLYDSFALVDSDGRPVFSDRFPFFTSRRSRNAMVAGDAVPVQSCWNGIAVFDAFPFQDAVRPLRFRAIPDSLAQRHVEGSECCLIHYDNPLTTKKGVWINPKARVGYGGIGYDSVRSFPSLAESVWGWWRAFFAGLVGSPWKPGMIAKQVRRWEKETPSNREAGVPCLIDEMQILVWNGWAHV